MTSWRAVEDLRSDLPGVLAHFRAGRTFAFSFGNGAPEAVMLTYDEFEDLDGEEKFKLPDEVLEPSVLATRLTALLTAMRAGTYSLVVWGEDGEPTTPSPSNSSARSARSKNPLATPADSKS